MKSDTEIFVEWLKKTIKIDKVKTAKQLADEVKISPSTISGWFSPKSNGPRDIQLRLDICKKLNADYDEIIQAARSHPDREFKPIKGQSSPTPKNIHPFRSDIEQEHFKIIQKFKNPEDAKEFNHVLLELERLDIEKFYSYFGDIKGYVKKLQELEKKKIEQAEAEKATFEAPGEKEA